MYAGRLKIVLLLLIGLGLVLASSAALAAEERAPLLMPGKKTLYQRAVSHPGASLLAEPAAGAKVLDSQVKTFTVFYIYGRQGDFTEVGVKTNGPAGFIRTSDLTEWPQALTLTFTDRTGRDPVLFFRDEQSLNQVASAKDIKARLDEIHKAVAAGGQNLPVLASEPSDEQGAVSKQRFYLMPVQNMTAPFEGVRFLQVASIDPGSDPAGGAPGDGKKRNDRDMKTAIAFVIDTTISMQPYIEQSVNVIREIFDSLERDKMLDNVAFGVVVFRNNTQAASGLEYVTKVISDFRTARNRQELESALAQVKEAGVSTHSFDEDSMAGVKEAVDKLSWQQYGSKLLILITDAGPLAGTDKYSATHMDAADLYDYARVQNIQPTVLHILSPAGAKDHAYAEKAYRALARHSGNDDAYLTVNAPTPEQGAREFGAMAKALAGSIATVVKNTAEGKLAGPGQAGPAETPEERAARLGQTLGYAMQLDFLGQARDNRAPQVVSAWIADMDLARLEAGLRKPAVEVAVLLTKNQLSDLQNQLKIIIDNAERTKKTNARDFFQSIRDASARMVRDPSAFSAKPGQNLQEMGVLGEFLEDLPYKSDVMLLTEEDWYRMSVGEQTAFVNRLKSRIRRYEEYDKDRANWESFGSPDAGDWVYRVPLTMLP